MLSVAGHNMSDAEAAEQALDAIKQETPDVILLDLVLPDMDGRTLVRELKDPGTRAIPVVAVTAYLDRFKEKDALAAGCEAYLVKPIDIRKLPRVISDVAKTLIHGGLKGWFDPLIMNSSAQFPTPPVTGSADLNISRLDADFGDGHSAFLQHILDSSTEYSVIGKDLEGKIVLWNEGARRLYGYEPEEVVGKANSVILHTPEDVAAGKPAEILEVALRTGKWEGIITRLRKNGQRFTARVMITPRRAATGRAIGFLLISKDISDEIRQQVLQESEERFRTMANSIPQLAYIAHADGYIY